MTVTRVKYLIWAPDLDALSQFYVDVFGAEITRQIPTVLTELSLHGAIIGIHGGGAGKKTWTGLTFETADVEVGAKEIVAAGGTLSKEPEWEDGEPPHLAMCVDPAGNEIMLTRRRG